MITHPPVWYKPELVKSEKTLEDEELKELLKDDAKVKVAGTLYGLILLLAF